jgi:acetaldehyde dehydrogenase
MPSPAKWPVAVIGSGNIGTDLLIKILRGDGPLIMAAMVGIDSHSDGLARAERTGVATTAGGIDALLAIPEFGDIRVVFDVTSADAHRANWAALREAGVRVLDLTPAVIGPYCVPVVNLDDHARRKEPVPVRQWFSPAARTPSSSVSCNSLAFDKRRNSVP